MAGREKHRIGFHLLEPALGVGLLGQIERLAAGRQYLAAFAGEPADNRRPRHAIVAGNIDAFASKIEQQRLGHGHSRECDCPRRHRGTYTLTGFGAGSYTVSLSKTTGQNSITSNDAARIAQHVAGISLLTSDNQKVTADVTGNNAISSQDAAKIAQVVAGLPLSPPNLTGQWKFYLPPGPTFPVGASPTSRTYPSVTSNITGDDYVGLLLGEVTGNWNNTGARPAGTVVRGQMSDVGEEGRTAEKPITVIAQPVVTAEGKEVVIPVSVDGVRGKEIISYEFNLRYDPTVIQPLENPVEVSGTVSRGLSVVTNATEPGLLLVVVYGAYPIDENGVLLNLGFMAVGKAGSVSPLMFERIMFNEGESRVMASSGRVEISAESE